nr:MULTISPECIES: tRNA lysidine(34) synthetase TilS [unclassified Arthrobacter]
MPLTSGSPGWGCATVVRRPRLSPVVANARNLLQHALESGGTPVGSLILVACSGGPDSLALASVAAHSARSGRYRVGAVVVDHGLHPDSAAVSAQTATKLTELGLEPVSVRAVTVDQTGMGPEAAARTARFGVLDAAAAELGASAVLLGHTLDDQAEQVLLGLARGSGTRSLAGMPAQRGRYLRPFLGLRREETVEICRFEGLEPWHDPSNSDPSFARSRVRTQVLPYLEDQLGPGVARALYRTSRILAQDADYLDRVSLEKYEQLHVLDGNDILLPEDALRALPPSLRQRVLALTAVRLGGEQPSFERIRATETLLERRGSAGPVQLGGFISVHRQVRGKSVPQGDPSYGSLVFRNNRALS